MMSKRQKQYFLGMEGVSNIAKLPQLANSLDSMHVRIICCLFRQSNVKNAIYQSILT
jgi:hypothetical protein